MSFTGSYTEEGLPAGVLGNKGTLENVEGNKGTLANFWEQGNKISKNYSTKTF